MTTTTRYVIQMYSTLDKRYNDLEGQLTDGYQTPEAARDAFAKRWERLSTHFPRERFKLIERTVIEKDVQL